MGLTYNVERGQIAFIRVELWRVMLCDLIEILRWGIAWEVRSVAYLAKDRVFRVF